jgi:hypothetical protein
MTTTATMTGPGSITIVNDAAAAITAQTFALTAELVFIDAAINQINNNLSKLNSQAIATNKQLSNLEIAILSVAAANSNQAVIQAAQAASVIQTNNFQVAATKDALKRTGQPEPVVPTPQQQLEQSVVEASAVNAAAAAQGAVTSFIQTQSATILTMITSTEVYKGVAKWLQDQKDTLVAAIFPPTPAEVASNAAAAAGVKTIPPV